MQDWQCNLSIVIQGEILKYTKRMINSIYSFFGHDLQIILSTWEGSDVSGLDYDVLVLSKDPGNMLIDEVSQTPDNVNRQIVSTKAGLAAAERPYCLKIRSDLLLRDGKFLSAFGKYDREAPPEFFRNRILICNYYTRNPRVMPMPYHPSDWVLFGRTEDLRKFYDVPCQSAEEIHWFKTHTRTNGDFYTNCLARYVPEQHICIRFLQKYCTAPCSTFYDATDVNIRDTENFLANNFVLLDYQKQWNLYFPKYRPNRYFEKFTLIKHRQWKTLYRKYSRKEDGFYWKCYLAECAMKKLFFYLRRRTLTLLHRLHIKDKAKRILTALGKGK